MVTRNGKQWTVRLNRPEAREVFLMGEFNDWSTTATPMQQVEEGVWQVTLRLASELRRFGFFVWDGNHFVGQPVRGSDVFGRTSITPAA